MLAPEDKLKLSMKPYLAATARFAYGDDTPRAFLERCLADLAVLEPKIGAFVHTNINGARVAADEASARWREGRTRSKIDGMPIGIKDIIETADMPTENGSPLFAGWRSGRDGASVAALREAGAVILGKTVTTEFAATEPRGTRNPHDLRRTPGGSSSAQRMAPRPAPDPSPPLVALAPPRPPEEPRPNGTVTVQRIAASPALANLLLAPVAAGGVLPMPATTIPPPGVPTSAAGSVPTVLAALRRDPRFAGLTIEWRSGAAVIAGRAARHADTWAFADALRKLPGVGRVVVGDVDVP